MASALGGFAARWPAAAEDFRFEIFGGDGPEDQAGALGLLARERAGRRKAGRRPSGGPWKRVPAGWSPPRAPAPGRQRGCGSASRAWRRSGRNACGWWRRYRSPGRPTPETTGLVSVATVTRKSNTSSPLEAPMATAMKSCMSLPDENAPGVPSRTCTRTASSASPSASAFAIAAYMARVMAFFLSGRLKRMTFNAPATPARSVRIWSVMAVPSRLGPVRRRVRKDQASAALAFSRIAAPAVALEQEPLGLRAPGWPRQSGQGPHVQALQGHPGRPARRARAWQRWRSGRTASDRAWRRSARRSGCLRPWPTACRRVGGLEVSDGGIEMACDAVECCDVGGAGSLGVGLEIGDQLRQPSRRPTRAACG